MRGRPQTIKAETILDAAGDVFRERGHGATTAEIATRAGVSEGILFHRYKNKEALLAAVIHREAELPQSLREMVGRAGRGSLSANIRSLIETVLDLVARIHPLFELGISSSTSAAFRDALLANPEKPAPERMVELLSSYLQAEMLAGRVRKVDPVCAARAIMGGCMDYTHAKRNFGANDDRSAFVRGLVDFVFHGIAASAHPEK
jgi:AcrR family transcriptional regulator